MKVAATLTVNGIAYPVELEPGTSLLDAVRDAIGLTGSKEGCDDSECGACMMLLDGKPVNSCSYLALQAEGSEVTTVEGLADGRELSPLQAAFLEHGGVQCGFCTPGMLVSATALLDANPGPTEDEVRIALSGNLCRCTGYDGIVKAVLSVGLVVRLARREHARRPDRRLAVRQAAQRHRRPATKDVLDARPPTRPSTANTPAQRCPARPDGRRSRSDGVLRPRARRLPPLDRRRDGGGGPRPRGRARPGEAARRASAPGSGKGRRSIRLSPSGPRTRSSASSAIRAVRRQLPTRDAEHPAGARSRRLSPPCGRRPAVAEGQDAEPRERRPHLAPVEERRRQRLAGLVEDLGPCPTARPTRRRGRPRSRCRSSRAGAARTRGRRTSRGRRPGEP